MKLATLMFVLVVGCGGGKEDTSKGTGGGGQRPDPASCDNTANSLSAARHQSLALGSKLPKFAAAIAEACRANAWPQGMRECIVATKDDATAKACVDSAAGKDKVVADLTKALADQGVKTAW